MRKLCVTADCTITGKPACGPKVQWDCIKGQFSGHYRWHKSGIRRGVNPYRYLYVIREKRDAIIALLQECGFTVLEVRREDAEHRRGGKRLKTDSELEVKYDHLLESKPKRHEGDGGHKSRKPKRRESGERKPKISEAIVEHKSRKPKRRESGERKPKISEAIVEHKSRKPKRSGTEHKRGAVPTGPMNIDDILKGVDIDLLKRKGGLQISGDGSSDPPIEINKKGQIVIHKFKMKM